MLGTEREAALHSEPAPDPAEGHHPVFSKFDCWEGEVEAGTSRNFLGVVTRDAYFNLLARHPQARYEWAPYPAFDEEYFEWIDLLEAVTAARDRFTMIELGAGWGRWLSNAAAALRQHSGLPYRLIGVEAEPTHFQWMKEHLADNDVDLRRCRLVQAAVADKDGWVWFRTAPPEECYGQSIRSAVSSEPLEEPPEGIDVPLEKVRAVSLNTLLRPLDRVDLLDLDVQGAELGILKAAREQLDRKVIRVHVGTHGKKTEPGLRTFFKELGWKNIHDYPRKSIRLTPWGTIEFGDGVQSWVNPAARPGGAASRVKSFVRGLVRTSPRLGRQARAAADTEPEPSRTARQLAPERRPLADTLQQMSAALDASEAGLRSATQQLAAARTAHQRLAEELKRLRGEPNPRE